MSAGPKARAKRLSYESPRVTEETLDEGGNYVSPAEEDGNAPKRRGDLGPLGTSQIP